MKNGIAKSYALKKIQQIVTETLADAYAQLRLLAPDLIRKYDLPKDVSYIMRRSDSEGIEFFTVQLPKLGDRFDEWLYGESGVMSLTGFDPSFLRPFWLYAGRTLCPLLAEVETANELSASQAKLVRLIRTLLLGLKKLTISLTDPRYEDK